MGHVHMEEYMLPFLQKRCVSYFGFYGKQGAEAEALHRGYNQITASYTSNPNR